MTDADRALIDELTKTRRECERIIEALTEDGYTLLSISETRALRIAECRLFIGRIQRIVTTYALDEDIDGLKDSVEDAVYDLVQNRL